MGRTRSTGNLVSDNIIFPDISNDRVGIGTTTPQFTLDVSGDINFTGTFRQNGDVFVASRWTSGTGDDIYRLNGDVGIGTTNPQYTLDVSGDINFTGTFYQNGSPFVASRWTAGTGNDIYKLDGSVGIGTTNPIEKLEVSDGNLYVSNGMIIQDNVLTGNHYIGTSFNALMVGPVEITGTIEVDGTYVVV